MMIDGLLVSNSSLDRGYKKFKPKIYIYFLYHTWLSYHYKSIEELGVY